MTTIDIDNSLEMRTQEGFYPVIFDRKQDKIVVGNFKTIVESTTVPKGESVEYFEYIEGTTLRIFYHEKDWRISTNKKIDAFSSAWSNNTSFGKQFENLIFSLTNEQMSFEEFTQTLDPKMVYFFLLPTYRHNRLGTKNNPHAFYLIGKQMYGSNEPVIVGSKLLYEKNLWSYPERLTLEQVEQKNVIAITPEYTTKLLLPEYQKAVQIRNNDPNLIKRYMELLISNPEWVEELKKLHPQEQSTFDQIDQSIQAFVLYIHRCYIYKFIHKERIQVPKDIHLFLTTVHNHYFETREKTTKKTIREVLFNQGLEQVSNLVFYK